MRVLCALLLKSNKVVLLVRTDTGWRSHSNSHNQSLLLLLHYITHHNSPFPNISAGLYEHPPFYEFVTQNWQVHGGSIGMDGVAIHDITTGLQRTFGEHHKLAGAIAATLSRDLGIDGPNSTVALYSGNHVDYLPSVMGITLTGAKLTPVNPLCTAKELQTILQRSHATVLIAHISRLDVALQAAVGTPIQHVVVMTDQPDGGSSHLEKPLPPGTTDLRAVQIAGQDGAFYETRHVVDTATHTVTLPYSSGTTGLPKGVQLTHQNLVANLLQCNVIEGPFSPPGSRLISPLPFFHIYAFTVSMVFSAYRGQTVYTNSGRFELPAFLQTIQDHCPQRAHLVPPILLGLAKHPIVDKYDLSSLEMIISAAAPLGLDVEEAVQARLQCGVKQAWGMSELSPIGTLQADDNVKSGSIGPLVPSTFGKIIDEQGNSLLAGEPGELCLKGPQVMKGYLEDPDKTAECLSAKSGWLRTGDVARYDENGFFYITDRIKELIKVRGFPVAPAELEALMM